MKYHLLALIITIVTTSCVEPQNTKNKSGVVISMAQAIEMKNKDIKHLDVKEFLKRVKDEVPEIAAYQGRTAPLNFHGSNIQVQVKENGMEKVKMTMPFMVLFELEEFIDDEVKIQIENEGQTLKDIVDFALKDGGRPKELINVKKGHKEFFVAII